MCGTWGTRGTHLAVLGIVLGCALFQRAERTDHRHGHARGGPANVEVHERAGRLGPIERLVGDLQRSEGIGLRARGQGAGAQHRALHSVEWRHGARGSGTHTGPQGQGRGSTQHHTRGREWEEVGGRGGRVDCLIREAERATVTSPPRPLSSIGPELQLLDLVVPPCWHQS